MRDESPSVIPTGRGRYSSGRRECAKGKEGLHPEAVSHLVTPKSICQAAGSRGSVRGCFAISVQFPMFWVNK